MDAQMRGRIEDEVERLDIFIRASEDWSKSYNKDPKSHAKLIKNEAAMKRALRAMFKKHADNIEQYISFGAYTQEVKKAQDAVKASRVDAAIDVTTIVSGDFFDGIDKDFITVAFQYLSTGTAIGAQAGESIYKIPLGLTSTSDIIQSLATDRIAWLVGKKVDKSGAIVDNPNSTYSITDKMREDIKNAVQQSIDAGEDRKHLVGRLGETINDLSRASTIAQTESVNAYGSGLLEFGKQSEAEGKEWQDVGAEDECKDYADEGVVALNYQYGGDTDAPAAHPNCRCGLRLVYGNESKK